MIRILLFLFMLSPSLAFGATQKLDPPVNSICQLRFLPAPFNWEKILGNKGSYSRALTFKEQKNYLMYFFELYSLVEKQKKARPHLDLSIQWFNHEGHWVTSETPDSFIDLARSNNHSSEKVDSWAKVLLYHKVFPSLVRRNKVYFENDPRVILADELLRSDSGFLDLFEFPIVDESKMVRHPPFAQTTYSEVKGFLSLLNRMSHAAVVPIDENKEEFFNVNKASLSGEEGWERVSNLRFGLPYEKELIQEFYNFDKYGVDGVMFSKFISEAYKLEYTFQREQQVIEFVDFLMGMEVRVSPILIGKLVVLVAHANETWEDAISLQRVLVQKLEQYMSY